MVKNINRSPTLMTWQAKKKKKKYYYFDVQGMFLMNEY